MNPLLLTDFYKVHHNKMYPEGTSMIYSNFTPRKSRIPGVDHVVFFGLQHFIMTHLIESFSKHFFKHTLRHAIESGKIKFDPPRTLKDIRSHLMKEYQKHIQVDTKHIEALWDLGYLPIEIKAVPEGTLVPIGVPCFTIKNTLPEFYWLTNYLETLISCSMWQAITSATIAYEYKKLLTKHAIKTTGSDSFVTWQGHDFSMRGLSSVDSAILSGMGHLLSFTGTDTIPALYQLERSYGAKGLIGASVPATEHSVMCMGEKDSEIETFSRLLDLYPTGILSVVSDTWNLWTVCTDYLPKLKDKILKRDGKLVIRPDSGDPVAIICGHPESASQTYEQYSNEGITKGKLAWSKSEYKGVVELLWDIFGGKINEYGYKELDSHIGAIYGDSITLDRAKAICERLEAKGFASTNVVLGIGSYTYQYNTRDTFGFAMKATYGQIRCEKMSGTSVEGREIWKDPITDDGTKKSAKGLLAVFEAERTVIGTDIKFKDLVLKDQCDWETENKGLLQTVFKDGKLTRQTTLEEIRAKLNSYVIPGIQSEVRKVA